MYRLSTRPFQLVTGSYIWKGTAFGGFKSRRDVPKLGSKMHRWQAPMDHFITHNFDGVGKTNDAIDAIYMVAYCLRAVVKY